MRPRSSPEFPPVIASQLLLDDLKVEVTKREDDLRARCEEQYEGARALQRTALTCQAWRDGELTNVAVAWVLACVFVRFLEDNNLVETLYLAGPDQAGVARARDQHEPFFRANPRLAGGASPIPRRDAARAIGPCRVRTPRPRSAR